MELWGNLKDFSLPDVIQLVGFGRKTGVLSVEHNGTGSMLYFAGGNVVHAVSNNIEGERAVYELFRVEEGEFRFQADAAAPRQTIFMDPTNLVMEAARLLDEASREKQARGQEEGRQSWEEADNFPSSSGLDASLAFDQAPPVEPVARPVAAGITPDEARKNITELLEKKFGKDSKRLTQAVAKCGDSLADFQEMVVRVERFVSAFVDSKEALKVGNELRAITARLPQAS